MSKPQSAASELPPSYPNRGGAIYKRIANHIQGQIESGQLRPGDRLQSERELSQEVGVNRLTVRRAFNLLEERGLINRRPGGGTYVNDERIERHASRLVPFTIAIRQLGLTPGARLVKFERQPASPIVCRMLELPPNAIVYNIFRVRLVNQEPAVLERFYVSASRFESFEQYDHELRSGYEIMETEYGVSVVTAEQSLEPVSATQREAELLEIKVGQPLMLERRLAFDSAGRPVECGKDLYRGDKFRFVTSNATLAFSYSKSK